MITFEKEVYGKRVIFVANKSYHFQGVCIKSNSLIVDFLVFFILPLRLFEMTGIGSIYANFLAIKYRPDYVIGVFYKHRVQIRPILEHELMHLKISENMAGRKEWMEHLNKNLDEVEEILMGKEKIWYRKR